MKKISVIILSVLALIFIQSCKKQNASSQDSITQDDVQSVMEVDRLTDELLGVIDTNAFDDTQKRTQASTLYFPSCVTKNINILSPTHFIITMEYDENGCQLPNGNTYTGKIIIDRYFDINNKEFSGSVSFDNFYVNGNKMEGESSFTRVLSNQVGLPQSHYEFDFQFTFPNGDVSKINGEKTRVWSEGFDTPSFDDNAFLITGELDILKRNGVEISLETIQPLKKLVTCPYYVSGTVQIEKDNKEVILDYGNGDCDNEATLIFPDGHTQTITLKP